MDEDPYAKRKEKASAFGGQMRDDLPTDLREVTEPYRPAYRGFDEEATRRAQETARRAGETGAARGEDANRAYVEEGPEEAARRTGRSADEVGDSIDRAARRARRP